MGRTRALASCRKADGAAPASARPRGQAGFTLIELMVVLAIVAGLLAVAAPGFVKLYASVRVALERQDLERQLLILPSQMRASGESGVLIDPQNDNPEHAVQGLGAATGIETWRTVRLDLPAGWTVTVPRPIFYHFTGACEGGEVTFSLPPLSLTYSLAAPLCRPQLADENAR